MKSLSTKTTKEHLQELVRLFRIMTDCPRCMPFTSISFDDHMEMLRKRFEDAERYLKDLERAPS